MKTLELKIFDLLVGRITILEFENWLYDSQEIIESIGSNPLYFDIVTINFKGKTWNKDLISITSNYFSKNTYQIIEINKACLDIVNAKTFSEINNILYQLLQNFDYNTDYSILLELYRVSDYFDLVNEGLIEIGSLCEEAKFYSNQVLKIISNGKDFQSIYENLEIRLEEFNPKNKF